MDQMILETQKWLNKTYGHDSRFKKVFEDGLTGWGTIRGLIMGMQIEIGASSIDGGIGPGTASAFKNKYPNGIIEQLPDDETESNIYGIIQGGLWCKGYPAEYGTITKNFYSATGKSIKRLREDMGLSGDAVVTLNIMKGLLSMMQFILLYHHGGRLEVRDIQQQMNKDYADYIGVTPCDGLFGREMNIALIKVLQAVQGSTPAQADGIIGPGTKSKIKVLTKSNYKNYLEHFKIAMYAFVCNGLKGLNYSTWAINLDLFIKKFINQYKLPETTIIDMNIWLQLLSSKGNADRKADACDTRFEITNELLAKLKQDGYKIVGRYINGGDYKEIRKGELERIISGGMKYFPIYQEQGTSASNFTENIGKLHAQRAAKAAHKWRIPETVIYFAVDYDALDYEVTSNIIPYFRGISENIGQGYKVGIYASRNICKRVSDEGYAVSSFVSDMSTAFSGNLGFPIPENWNYDQFHEIKKYGGKWDLDKVAYSGKIPAADKVLYKYVKPRNPNNIELSGLKNISKEKIDKSTNYTNMDVISLIWHLEKEHINYSEIFDLKLKNFHGVLNFLSKNYLNEFPWQFANEIYDVMFEIYLRKENNSLLKAVEPLRDRRGEYFKDKINGMIDVPHLATTTLAYSTVSLAPDFWTGWGGDLATAMKNINIIHKNNPKDNHQRIADEVVGAVEFDSEYFKTLNLEDAYNLFNYPDMCSDADAINIAYKIKNSNDNPHLLSTVLSVYYNSINNNVRFLGYFKDLGRDMNPESLGNTIFDKMNKMIENGGLALLWKKATKEDKQVASNAFANYIISSLYK